MPLLPLPPRATNAMDVLVQIGAEIPIDHVSEPVDVDTARGDIRRNQHWKYAAMKSLEQLLALCL